ncbi:MAG: hypothetical protein PF487_13190 [Bacteroidales bacterium]|jgi:cell fate regulator YaaT (PSP1 superfamily)|nr:hypothetical protein [Bacteroidales bacterium]
MRTLKFTHEEIEMIEKSLENTSSNILKIVNHNSKALDDKSKKSMRQSAASYDILHKLISKGKKDV